jgi:hypothetical protein
MFRTREFVIRLALEHFKNNTQIALTGNGISFPTQYILKFYRNYEYVDEHCFILLSIVHV